MKAVRTGAILKATDGLKDTGFDGAIIFLTEHNAGGAVGLVINRPFARSLNQLVEFRHSRHFPLYEGGPVDTEHLFFLHRRPNLIQEGIPVIQGIYYGGNFKQVVTAINNRSLSEEDVKIFVGYCGWETGQLEAEVEEGSWTIEEQLAHSVFQP